MSRLALHLLGPPCLELDGEEIHISRRKAVALLAYLAVTGLPHSRDSLATLLWPELDQSTARARLRRALAALREALQQAQDDATGDGWLDADRDTVGLDADAEIRLDVAMFHDRLAACETHGHPPAEVCPDCLPLLEEAVDLYHDHFLAGFTLRDSPGFDEFQFFQTEGLKDELAGALERLVRYHGDRGEYEPAIGYARRWLALDPLHEPAHRHLMTLYAQSGQQSAALRQYQLLEQTLTEEVGLSPSEETTALFEQIRAGEEIGLEAEAPRVPPHNLPPQPTPFIGRKVELAELDRLIADPDVRLITIVGPGGMGKTRLALACAERQLTRSSPFFAHGIFFVPLAPLSEVDQIAYRLADALNIQLQGGAQETRTPKQQILDYLRPRRMLLLMDNFEHLLEGAELVRDISRTAPEIQILVTSRERLHVQAEQVYPVQGLEFPDWETPQDAADYTAALLFRQSARRVRPDFELSEGSDLIYLARICRLVGGMPLALELAAGWVDILSLAEIAAEIQRGLDFLETDLRDVPERHRGIRAVFDTTWRRLTEADREAMARFSVFHGGCTREAAQAVSGASLRMLARLSDKSLIQYQKADGRYRMHELLRQYAGEKLAQDPESEIAAQKAHCAYYCTALQEWEKALKSPRQPTAVAEIAADYQNIRAAWDLADEQTDLHYLRTAVDGLGEYYIVSNRPFEARAVFEKAAGRLQAVHGPSPSTAEATLLLAQLLAWRVAFGPDTFLSHFQHTDENDEKLLRQSLALLASPALAGEDTRHEEAFVHYRLGGFLRRARSAAQVEEGRDHLEASLRLYHVLGDQVGTADVLHALSWHALSEGTLEQCKRLITESLALRRQTGEPRRLAWSLIVLGDINRWRLMVYDEAFEAYEEAYAIAQACGDLLGMASARQGTAVLAWFLGEFDLALDALEQALTLSQQAGHQYRAALCQFEIGLTQAYRGRFSRAEALIQGVATDQRLVSEDIKVCLALVHTHRGQYEAGRAQAGMVAGTARGAYSPVWPLRLLSWMALAREDYAEALASSQQSLELCQTLKLLEREWVAWSQVPLGRALHGLGRHDEAKWVLFQALQTCVEIRAFLPLMHLMPIIPVVLADDEDAELKERAVELYALAECLPFVANSRLFEDVAGRHVRNAAANLPPEVLSAAQECGRNLDLWETAAALLDELPRMGWTD